MPKKLIESSNDQRLKGALQKKAYKIILNWAELDTSGKLEERKETELEAEL